MHHAGTCEACGQPLPFVAMRTNDKNDDKLEHARGVAEYLGAEEPARQRRSNGVRKPHLTSHALLRYLQRAWLVDIDRARREIMTKETIAYILQGAQAISITYEGRRFRMPIVDGRILTCLSKTERPRFMIRGERRPVYEEGLREKLSEYFIEMAEEMMGVAS